MNALSTAIVPRALRLISPQSARRLFGLDGDRVFAAPGEPFVFELEGAELVRRSLSAVPPERPAEGSLFWLPFWRLRFRAEVSGEGAAVPVVKSVFDDSGAYVRAFSLLNALYIGDPGLRLTLDGFEPTGRIEVPPACLGVRLPSSEAAGIARLFLLEKADRISDVTGARVAAEIAELELQMLPFDRREGCLQMLVGPGTRFREETLVDLRGMDETLGVIGRALR